MVGRVLSFGRSPHQNVQELLPWFQNGTLQGEEAVKVEEHLRGCPGCRAELECLRVMQSEYLESEVATEAQAALAKLRPRLQEALPAKRTPRRSTGRAAALTAPFPVWFKLAMAAQFALVFGLGWAVLQPERAGLAYRVLSASGAPERAVGSLVVVFDPAAPQREVARILHASGGRVVDGPTESNGYVVAVADGGLSAALARLRTEPAVVLAEPLQLERTR
jgi:Putative zinc-finger